MVAQRLALPSNSETLVGPLRLHGFSTASPDSSRSHRNWGM